MAGESKLQARIIKWLKANGYWVIKVVVASTDGIPDIIACSPRGKLVAIEVKYGSGTPSELQKYHINEIIKRGGIAFVAWDLETVQEKLNEDNTSNV